ncbi:MAG TPA: phosphodiester glycosidase family protein [Actinomycetes bacterium]|nr:phosphodiester glycosidase family protein [Actinomycetes bacterium]
MSLAVNARRHGLVLLTASSLVAGLGVVATTTADAATPCNSNVTSLSQDNAQRFAGGSKLKRYTASVNYPEGSASYDQTAKILMATYPSTAYPSTLTARIGNRIKSGDMVKAQQPTAVSALNGDFFVTPTIRGKTLEMARGPMIKNGRIIRADRNRQRVVGVDTNHKPFGGWIGVRGVVQTGTSPNVDIQGVNWQKVQGGGATIYTTDWNSSSTTPRPAGVSELVINGHNKITQVRSSTKNTAQLGAPVASGTRVVAFSENWALVGAGGVVGQRVHVNMRQSTDSGVKLEAAVGRGLPLIENGVAAPLGCDAYADKAARPRTMIGWTKAGVWRTVTVPGKLFTGPGLRNGGFGLSNEAAIAKKLGLYFAYEVDGGGSTTLYTRSNGGKWSRRDLYGLDTSTGTYEREVVNGLAFMVP